MPINSQVNSRVNVTRFLIEISLHLEIKLAKFILPSLLNEMLAMSLESVCTISSKSHGSLSKAMLKTEWTLQALSAPCPRFKQPSKLGQHIHGVI